MLKRSSLDYWLNLIFAKQFVGLVRKYKRRLKLLENEDTGSEDK